NALWIYWTNGDDEVDLTEKELYSLDNENLINKNKITEIFRIKTNIFDFEAPICKSFNKFNYLSKINTDLFTDDIPVIKTYEEYKEEQAHELNNDSKEPWSKNEVPYELVDHICEPFCFKNVKTKWPTCNQNNNGFYGKLKEEALKQNAIYERSRDKEEPKDDQDMKDFKSNKVRNDAPYYSKEEEQDKEDKCELIGNPRQEPPTYKFRRFEMIKYSFGPGEEYVAIKEQKYNDLKRANEDECHAYQEIFRIMDEGWFVTRAK
nr:hypothetical protein [Tanacetum cinerariifolium]